MRREGTREPLGEQHVRDLLGIRVRAASRAERADLLQRARQALRVARELHGGGVGEQLALPRDRGLDQPAEEQADVAEREHDKRCEIDHRDGAAALAAAAARDRARAEPGRAISAMTDQPNSTPISRMLSRMSPFRMWLNSWAITPCSSSRLSVLERAARDGDRGVGGRVARRRRR